MTQLSHTEIPQYLDVDACLVLEDGAVFFGKRFGAREGTAQGEVVFNTSMAGYQEIATDPSYRGQMVVLTHPQIGNYGVQAEAMESRRPWVSALVVRDLARFPNHWLMTGRLEDALEEAGVPGLAGVDTRALTRHLRTQGTLRAALVSVHREQPLQSQVAQLEEALALAQNTTPLSEQDLVAEVSDPSGVNARSSRSVMAVPRAPLRIALIDFGVKHNIARSLAARGVDVDVLPWTTSFAEVTERQVHGVVLSNGPGDPEQLGAAADLARGLVEAGIPCLGICLGHQILGIAAGGTTSRLKFGHHGANHPVQNLATGQVHITSQNHEFQVDASSIGEESGFRVSMQNLNDASVEGLAHRELPVFSVQYHPEGCPGPQDNQYVFERFLDMVEHPISGWDALVRPSDSVDAIGLSNYWTWGSHPQSPGR